MSAEDDVRREIHRLEAMTDEVFTAVGVEVQRSIQEGSEITGAPGQPVAEGTLRASWQVVDETPDLKSVETNLEYAEAIEDGIGKYGPLTLRSEVGGFHSVALTIAGLPHLVDAVVQRVASEHGETLGGRNGWRGEDGG